MVAALALALLPILATVVREMRVSGVSEESSTPTLVELREGWPRIIFPAWGALPVP